MNWRWKTTCERGSEDDFTGHQSAHLLKNLGSAGNLTTDAHLAALAMERALVLHSTDADFSRFPGLKWKNPLI